MISNQWGEVISVAWRRGRLITFSPLITDYFRQKKAPPAHRGRRSEFLANREFYFSSGAFASFQPEMPAERCFTLV